MHWDSSGVGVHQNFNVELFSGTINHITLKLGMMVVCDESFPKNAKFEFLAQRSWSPGAVISVKNTKKL